MLALFVLLQVLLLQAMHLKRRRESKDETEDVVATKRICLEPVGHMAALPEDILLLIGSQLLPDSRIIVKHPNPFWHLVRVSKRWYGFFTSISFISLARDNKFYAWHLLSRNRQMIVSSEADRRLVYSARGLLTQSQMKDLLMNNNDLDVLAFLSQTLPIRYIDERLYQEAFQLLHGPFTGALNPLFYAYVAELESFGGQKFRGLCVAYQKLPMAQNFLFSVPMHLIVKILLLNRLNLGCCSLYDFLNDSVMQIYGMYPEDRSSLKQWLVRLKKIYLPDTSYFSDLLSEAFIMEWIIAIILGDTEFLSLFDFILTDEEALIASTSRHHLGPHFLRFFRSGFASDPETISLILGCLNVHFFLNGGWKNTYHFGREAVLQAMNVFILNSTNQKLKVLAAGVIQEVSRR